MLDGTFDSLNILIPRDYLDALADDAGAARVGDLFVPEAWTTQDQVVANLEPLLLAAVGSVSTPLLRDHLALTTAVHLAERYGGLSKLSIRKGALAAWQERRAKAMIAASLDGGTSLAAVAADCGLSVTHFAKAFKATVGMTPHAWLQALRIEAATSYLRGATPLAEIAALCGFADQSHFTRTFRRATGLAPGGWRRAL